LRVSMRSRRGGRNIKAGRTREKREKKTISVDGRVR